jgi:hypothetical protein
MRFSDNNDTMIALLQQIVENTGQPPQQQFEQTIEGASIDERIGVVPAQNVIIKETAHLEHANSDGSVTLSPGDEKKIAEFNENVAHAVLAFGATDTNNVLYSLYLDGDPLIGPTNGPLGTVNNLFSFVQKYGGAIPADKRCSLRAEYPEAATGDVQVVGRLHVEVV